MIGPYLRLARQLPPHIVARKALHLVQRVVRRKGRVALDFCQTSYLAEHASQRELARIEIEANAVPRDLRATLRTLSGHYLRHEFDVLGSGRVVPSYGCEAPGFLGRRYSGGPAAPRQGGDGLERVVNRANLSRSADIWRCIGHDSYIPIDWQRDVKSGYRWSATRHSYATPIPVDAGADVKMPWEMARLQHLPQLALCAILAARGCDGFEPQQRYLNEISNQLLDFIATNPPRFGVNWINAMEVGIRAANMTLTLALLFGAQQRLSDDVEQIVTNSLFDHAHFVSSHLEFSEIGRSNHYIGDIAGLLWASWFLAGAEADRWWNFAAMEIVGEAANQFLPDGGNYEGSTSYHRLSGEMIAFSIALMRGERERSVPEFPASVVERVARAGSFSQAIRGDDGTAIQIGDADSGRFFRLHPVGDGATAFVENELDHLGFVEAVHALTGAAEQSSRLDAIVVRALAAKPIVASSHLPDFPDFGDLEALLAPNGQDRRRDIMFGQPLDPSRWTRSAFPDFGLYIFRHDEGALVAFRSAGLHPKAAPRGHVHDDNLSIEYRFPAASRRDPGSFVYTPSVELRNLYRSAAAHDAPRVQGQPVMTFGSNLFDAEPRAAACVAWRPDGVAGEIKGAWGTLRRVVRIASDRLSIVDSVDPPSKLAEIPESLPFSAGYGRR